MLHGRRADGDKRLHFRANPDGRWPHGFAEGTIILGAAVIDDVMGLFVLALLAASTLR